MSARNINSAIHQRRRLVHPPVAGSASPDATRITLRRSPAAVSVSPSTAPIGALWSLVACDSKFVIGAWSCAATGSTVASADSSGVGATFIIPGPTGFEDGFCDYASPQGESPAIPVGKWFPIGGWLELATDASEEFAVYQNGTRYWELTGVTTDTANSEWSQWCIDNWADDLAPPRSTLYVDDVSVRNTR